MNHDLYLLVAFLTHAIVGYAVVRGLSDLPPAAGVVGALAPDADLYLGPLLGFPVVHRGAIHTPAALVVLVSGAFLGGALLDSVLAGRTGRRVPAALGVGFLTHLVLDSFTDAGIMWLYPASSASASLGVPIHSGPWTAVLWLASLAIVRFGPGLRTRVRDGDLRLRGDRE